MELMPSSALPPLYAGWLDQMLAGPLPEETESTCSQCAMCASGNAALSSAAGFFSPQIKCCTYIPRLWNFLVGGILADDDPAALRGRATVEERIGRKVGVSPIGLFPDPVQVLLYEQGKEASFGRSLTLRCPHYLEDSGQCGVWKHREATCAT